MGSLYATSTCVLRHARPRQARPPRDSLDDGFLGPHPDGYRAGLGIEPTPDASLKAPLHLELSGDKLVLRTCGEA